jgi:hypothetical protein
MIVRAEWRAIRMWTSQAEQVVSRLIAMLLADRSNTAPTHAARQNSLPIGEDMWGDYYLRPNGDVVIVGEDLYQPDVDSVYSDWKRVLPVLVWGSRRYPELQDVLPVRGPGAVDCACHSIPVFAEGKVLCPECDGLGWLPGGVLNELK